MRNHFEIEKLDNRSSDITFSNLFLQFLKIGATSFGGFMALISMIEKQFVEKNKLVQSDELLDIISVATMLPGPMAVNVVAFVGYKLRGIKGAMISMLAVLLPTLFLIITLSHMYFQYGSMPEIDSVFKGILPAVCAIILSVAVNMAKKSLVDIKQGAICLIALLIYLLVGGFLVTLTIIVCSGALGWVIYKDNTDTTNTSIVGLGKTKLILFFKGNRIFLSAIIGITAVLIILPFVLDVNHSSVLRLRNLYVTFSGISLTLFGGGYVFIPMLQELVVDQLHWVTSKEFIDGIALGQVTPGPIMISAAFIGYKLSGIAGAIVSTIAMFLPPAILMIIVSTFIEDIKKSQVMNAAFKGIRAAVIGMIFAAGWTISKSIGFEVFPLLILLTAFIATYWFRVNIVYIIPLSGLIGLILL